jgi:hypothetical protein
LAPENLGLQFLKPEGPIRRAYKVAQKWPAQGTGRSPAAAADVSAEIP